MAGAYGAIAIINIILRAIETPFVPIILTVKLIKMIGDYIDKRRQIGKYLEGTSSEMNEMRMSEAEKIVRAIQDIDKDESQAMPEKLRKEMLEYFSDEKRDMGTLIDTSKKMQKLAKAKKGFEPVKSMEPDHPRWERY